MPSNYKKLIIFNVTTSNSKFLRIIFDTPYIILKLDLKGFIERFRTSQYQLFKIILHFKLTAL